MNSEAGALQQRALDLMKAKQKVGLLAHPNAACGLMDHVCVCAQSRIAPF
jgi:hypothetical protein